MLWIFHLTGTSVIPVFYRGLYAALTANTQHPLVIYMEPMVMIQIVPDPPVSFIWAFLVDLLYLFCKLFVFCGSVAQLPGCPLVVCAAGYVQQRTG